MNPAHGTWALLPLKQLDRAKERLAAVIDATSRRQLVLAMARDVLAALRAADIAPACTRIVSDDAAVAALAAEAGVGVFVPPGVVADPLNRALEAAVAAAHAAGARDVLCLHADLPLASGEALRELLVMHGGRGGITLVTDRAGTGTNCLLGAGRGLPALCFGRDSRRRHREACAAAGLGYREFSRVELGFDVDEPEDLRALVALAQTPDNALGTHTRTLLATPAFASLALPP